MYERDTILTLKEQRKPDPETGEEFPYNRVRVVGQSPINQQRGDWTGEDAKGVIIVAESNFGATLDEPFGKLRQLYDVTEVPEWEPAVKPEVLAAEAARQARARANAAPAKTPEEVFAEEAPGVPPEEGQTRGRTTPSPLDGPNGPESDKSPLDA